MWGVVKKVEVDNGYTAAESYTAGSNNLLGHVDSSSTLGTLVRATKLPSSSSPSPCPSRLPIAGPSSCACGGEVRYTVRVRRGVL